MLINMTPTVRTIEEMADHFENSAKALATTQGNSFNEYDKPLKDKAEIEFGGQVFR